MQLRSLCVYCGSSPGRLPAYVEAADAFGRLLATRGIRLVYGGGRTGLMGAVADGALAAGGEVLGIIPRGLVEKEVGHTGLTERQVVDSMHERKQRMADASDAFVALPGGIGTLEELIEVYTWSQLGFQDKPCGVLDVQGFYAPLEHFLDHMVDHRFLKQAHRATLFVEDDAARLLARLAAYEPSAGGKWMDGAER
ncbi:MAG: TIGR00730 family Rossman fold protein [Pseudomonadales bacterium]|jgi:uncharacterized protein (TIGR00730 family)|nr:TIGR00730 family Rossman fold protein [Pseudomonadales bacterium]